MAKILQHWCPFETQFRTLTYLHLSTITFVTILFCFQFLDVLQHLSENVFVLEVIPKYKPLFGKGLCILHDGRFYVTACTNARLRFSVMCCQ